MDVTLPNVDDITTLGGGAAVLQAEEMDSNILFVTCSDCIGADAVTFI